MNKIYENRIMYYKMDIDNRDIERYRIDYIKY